MRLQRDDLVTRIHFMNMKTRNISSIGRKENHESHFRDRQSNDESLKGHGWGAGEFADEMGRILSNPSPRLHAGVPGLGMRYSIYIRFLEPFP